MNVSPYHKKNYDEKLNSLHQQMRALRIECGKLLDRQNETEKSLCCVGGKAVDTSSAYNTGGESCRSDSHTPEGVNNSPQVLHRSIMPMKIPEHSQLQPTQSKLILIQNKGELRRCSQLPSCSSSSLFLTREALQNNTNQVDQLKTQLKQTANKEAMEHSKKFRIPSLSIVMKDDTPKPESKEPKQSTSVKTRIINIAMPKFFRNTVAQTKIYLLNEQPPGSAQKPIIDASEQKERLEEEKKFQMEKETVIMRNKETEKEKRENELNELNSKKEETSQSQDYQEEPQYKWKIKRRSDGSRYVVRRAVRGEVLKKREAEINRERTGISTDDDAMSDLKLGHFHTREERKRQLERERLRKLQQQNTKLQQRTLATEQLINQLRDKKLAKKKQKEILDEFITTQEMLSERCKEGASLQGIVTITTV